MNNGGKVEPDCLGMGLRGCPARQAGCSSKVTFHQPRRVPQRHLSTDTGGRLIPRIVPGVIGTLMSGIVQQVSATDNVDAPWRLYRARPCGGMRSRISGVTAAWKGNFVCVT